MLPMHEDVQMQAATADKTVHITLMILFIVSLSSFIIARFFCLLNFFFHSLSIALQTIYPSFIDIAKVRTFPIPEKQNSP